MPFSMDDLNDIVTSLQADDPLPLGDPEKTFYDFGYDSLDLSGIFLELEKRYGLNISEQDMQTLESPNQVIKYMNDRISS